MSSNPRNPSNLEKEITAMTALAQLGHSSHRRWIIRKVNGTWRDLLELNLKEDFAEIHYVHDANDTIHCYVKTKVPQNASEMAKEFPGYTMKVASSPCDFCKMADLGKVCKGFYPTDYYTRRVQDEEWLYDKIDPSYDSDVEYLGTYPDIATLDDFNFH